MEQEVREKLLQLNKDFYSTYTQSFSSSRHTIQPGVKQLLDQIVSKDKILDLGCGNGTFSRALAEKVYNGSYLGLDNNPAFLSEAAKALPEESAWHFAFLEQDLSDLNWADTFLREYFDVITAFAFLHHVPGKEYQANFFNQAVELLVSGGMFILSVWQPSKDSRLNSHLLPWSTLDLLPSVLDQGDLLMDWRGGGVDQATGMRYVHEFSQEELIEIGQAAGFELNLGFHSDGHTRNLALYQVWRKP